MALKPARQVDAVVCVADRGVQLGEVVALCLDDSAAPRLSQARKKCGIHKSSSR